MISLVLGGLVSVPWEEARSWSPEQAMAAQILAGEAQGGIWSWQEMRWRRPDERPS